MGVPVFGLGTFRLKDQTVIDSVKMALSLGYRAIDTAQIYGNEAEVGEAVAESDVNRNDLFITTKIWTDNFSRDKLIPSLKESLRKLRTEYVDMTLIHWPLINNEVPVEEYMTSLLEAKKQGLTRQIGVSNFTVDLMRQAIDAVGINEIGTNQIELHPYLQNRKVAEFAGQNNIQITSYMTLGYGKILSDPVIIDIAEQHGAAPAQVALAWALQLGYAVIPSSTSKAHLQSNLSALELTLSEQDMQRIAELDRNERMVDPKGLRCNWDK